MPNWKGLGRPFGGNGAGEKCWKNVGEERISRVVITRKI